MNIQENAPQSSVRTNEGRSVLDFRSQIRSAAQVGLAAMLFLAVGCDQQSDPAMPGSEAGQPASGKSDASDDESTEEYEQSLESVDECVDALESLAEKSGREWTNDDAASQPECSDVDVQRDDDSAAPDDADKSVGYIAYGECSNVCFNWSGRVAYQRSTRQYSHSHRETALANAIVDAEYAVELLAYSACGNYGQTYGCSSWIAN